MGPQRNLTTLTGALLFLHPRCQVLGHAGIRIFDGPRMDFLAAYSPQRFECCQRYAMIISRERRRGRSITASHAFRERARMRAAFDASGLDLVKQDVRSLFWKDFARLMNHLRRHEIDVGALLEAEPRLRFLMPVRNPLDCAESHVHTAGGPQFRGSVSVESVLDSVLADFHWCRRLQAVYPECFFHFFEYELDRDLLTRLAAFLQLEPEENWIEHALTAYDVRSEYRHDDERRTHFTKRVETWFADDPDFASALLRFLPEHA